MAIISYSDGSHDLLDIAEFHDRPIEDYSIPCQQLLKENLLKEV